MKLLKINGVVYDEIVDYSLTFEQLWKDGSGRSPYTGVWNGQLLGNFEPMKVTLKIFDKNKLSKLIKDLRKGNINVTKFDLAEQKEKTMVFYRATYTVNIKQFYDEGKEQRYGNIEIEFIPHRPI